MKKQRNMYQMKEQDKTSEVEGALNETEISDLTSTIQSNGHKDAQWTQEKNE